MKLEISLFCNISGPSELESNEDLFIFFYLFQCSPWALGGMGQSRVLDVRLGMLHLTFSVIYLNTDNEIYSLRIEKVGRFGEQQQQQKKLLFVNADF